MSLADEIADFIEHRIALKCPMSDVAIKRLTNRAKRMAEKGIDLTDVFDRAISSEWLSIYEPKDLAPRPAAHKIYNEPNYGERSTAEAASAAVDEARKQLRRVK